MAESRSSSSSSPSPSPRRAKSEFPIKVYAMLELADNFFDFAQAVTWLPHGRAFRIHNKVKFMKEVVPVFFNQTKIRSFNRQLHLWGFHRIGRGSDQIWYHNNFLRGKPEDMKLMVRTKIKGCKDAVSSEGMRVPNFDDMPPLPVCDKRSSAILDAMEQAIMKLPHSSGAIAAHCCFTMPSATVSPPHPGNVMTLPRTGSPCQFNVDYNHNGSFELPSPPTFQRRVSFGSELMTQPCIPTVNYHLSLQVNFESSQPMHETSVQGQGPHHFDFEPEQSHIFHDDNLNDFCFSSVQYKHDEEDFSPLPFEEDSIPCDDFASFIEGAIQLIEG